MKSKTLWRLLALLTALGLVAAACGSDSDSTEAGDSADMSADEQPGAGISVTQARANWSTSYMQAAIYNQLMTELGYEMNDPSGSEVDPATFFPALAEGDFDFWTESWQPLYDFQYINTNESIMNNVTTVGMQMEAGGLQGIMIDIKTADELGITHIDQIAEDPELSAVFDVTGDGIADIHGCDVGWGCEATIESWLSTNGWEGTGLDQVSATYNAVFAEAVGRIADGEPTLVYTWTPSAYVTELIPGENVYWLATNKPLPEQAGVASLGEDTCPGQPCEMGFAAADIRVTGNNAFLEANPAAAKLFELVEISVIDVAQQNVLYDGGENTEEDVNRHAAEWIEKNRAQVDEWLAAARAAA